MSPQDLPKSSARKTKMDPDRNPKTSTGKIGEILGSGEDAKNSLVYLTIMWCFIAGNVITFFVVLNNWCFRQNEKVPDIVSDIKNTWSIIIPIITLALGYAFGRKGK